MKNLNVVALVMHSNKEVLEYREYQGYYNISDNIPPITSMEYHRRLKIIDKISNDNTQYIGIDSNGNMFTFEPSQIISIDNRANSLDVLLKEKSQ